MLNLEKTVNFSHIVSDKVVSVKLCPAVTPFKPLATLHKKSHFSKSSTIISPSCDNDTEQVAAKDSNYTVVYGNL